jgi:sugar transferase (PEP-CTERM system associated)
MHRSLVRSLVLVSLETGLVLALVALATWLRLGPDDALKVYRDEGGLLKAGIVTFVTQLCLYYADLYSLRKGADRRELFVSIVQALGAASFILAAIYYWFPELMLGRGVFLYAAMLVIAAVIGWRLAYEFVSKRMGPGERLLLVGTSVAAVNLVKELHEHRVELGVDIVGFVDPDPAKVGQSLVNPGIIGTVDDIPGIVQRMRVDRVVVSLADARGKLPMDRLLQMKLNSGVLFDHLPTVYEEFTGKIAIENLRPSWLIFSEGFRKTRVLLATKRALDIICALGGLILAAPLLAITAALVKLTSPGPALYHQKRVGLQGREFTVHKFRSMRQDAEAGTGAVWATAGDARVTAVGKFIRRTRLDEIPQLWNVLIGDMSMVGPRPERPEFVGKLTEQIPFYGLRHSVRPGVTGWAQVRYTYGASVEDAMEKLQFDLFYVKHMSLPFDLFVLLSTVKTVILRRGAQ